MKILKFFCFISLILSVAMASGEVRTCSNQSDLDDFSARWKIITIIGFEFGNVFCKVSSGEQNDICATKYTLESPNFNDLMSSYASGTTICHDQIIIQCLSWCSSYSVGVDYCSNKCILPNFKADQ